MSKEVDLLLSTFKNPILEFIKELKDEVVQLFDIGLSSYVESQRNKFIKIKTFLYRDVLVDFYDTYFQVSLNKSGEQISITKIEDVFFENKYIAIIGNAGSGKSMISKFCFLNCIDTLFKIPIFIEIRNLNNSEKSLVDYIKDTISNNKLSLNYKIMERLLNSGNFLFIFDGYDELYSKNKAQITDDLDRFIDQYSKNYFIITSRPSAGVESFPRFDNLYVSPLTRKEVNQFIDKQLRDCEDNKSLALKIIDVLNKPENKEYIDYLNNPLLLSMFILTFNLYPELPKSKAKFYWNVFDTLATKHDSVTKRGGYQHERKSNLKIEEIEEILKWFAYKSLFDEIFNFDYNYLYENINKIKIKSGFDFDTKNLIDDLIVSISIIIVDGIEYKFPHKTLQEYFAASLISAQNQEHKEIIYGQKMEISNFSGENTNLWNLCVELDKRSFYQYFVLRKLKDYLSEISKSKTEDTFKQIVFYHDFAQNLSKKPKLPYTISGYKYSNFAIFNITDFLTEYPLTNFSLKNVSKDLNNIFAELKDNNVLLVNTNSHGEKNSFSLYYRSLISLKNFHYYYTEFELERLTKSYIKSLKVIISKIEIELKNDDAKNISLLDI